jgi:hypothetical protein
VFVCVLAGTHPILPPGRPLCIAVVMEWARKQPFISGR